MKVIDAILSRRSTRNFLSKDVPFEKVMDCIEAAQWAPSAGNLQNTRFILVTDEEKKQEVANVCVDQQWMVQAPYLVVFCNEPEDIVKEFEDRGEKYAREATAASVMNFLLAAQENGLATCWVGAFDEMGLRRVLQMPDDVVPEAIVAVGYAFESPKSSRISVDLITYFDTFGNKKRKKKGLLAELKNALKKSSSDRKGSLP